MLIRDHFFGIAAMIKPTKTISRECWAQKGFGTTDQPRARSRQGDEVEKKIHLILETMGLKASSQAKRLS